MCIRANHNTLLPCSGKGITFNHTSVQIYLLTSSQRARQQVVDLCRWAGDGWFLNDGAWQFRMAVSTGRRNSTGTMNRSPRVLLPRLPFTLQLGCSMSLQLNGQCLTSTYRLTFVTESVIMVVCKTNVESAHGGYTPVTSKVNVCRLVGGSFVPQYVHLKLCTGRKRGKWEIISISLLSCMTCFFVTRAILVCFSNSILASETTSDLLIMEVTKCCCYPTHSYRPLACY